MNDTELDDMLNQWESPEVPARLRESIKLPPPQRKWHFSLPLWHLSKGLFAGVAIGVVVCFIGVAAAFPTALSPTPRFNLISETLRYNPDGSSKVVEYRASTAQNGRENVLEQTFPDSWFMTVHARFFGAVHHLLGLTYGGPVSLASDCSSPGTSVAGQTTLLGYQVTKLLFDDQKAGRYTEWRAPKLDCIAMKTTWEEPSNGGFRVVEEKRPLGVRVNHAQ